MLSLLRRVYKVVIVDTPAVVNDINLAFLDTSDTILEVVTYDSTTIHSTMVDGRRVPDDRLPAVQGPLPREPRRLDRRHRPRGPEPGARPGAGALRRARAARWSSHANNEGIPFVLADPSAQISQDVMRTAAELSGRVPAAAARR